MKVKMKFCILAMFVLTVAAVWFETGEAGAFTISDDGEYALVLKCQMRTRLSMDNSQAR